MMSWIMSPILKLSASSNNLSFNLCQIKPVMKFAISGKGGVGKTVLASFLCRVFADQGYSVIAIDADPDSNLAATIGFPHPEEITPISELSDLIEERTGARPGKSASMFKLSP